MPQPHRTVHLQTRASCIATLRRIVRISRESKGRGGKQVTLIRGVPLAPTDLDTLGKQLKSACGSGGTVKDGVIEVQGDHCDKVIALLQAQGYKVKRAGG
jgi:translation initiation factor 1